MSTHYENCLQEVDRELGVKSCAYLLSNRDEHAYDIADILFFRGNAHAALGMTEKAITDFDECIRTDPQYKAAFHNRAAAHRTRGRRDLALRDYSAALSIDPDLTITLINRGTLFAEGNRVDEAIADFTAAIQSDPDSGDAYNWRAIAYCVTGKASEAFDDFIQTMRLKSQTIEDLRPALGRFAFAVPAGADQSDPALRKALRGWTRSGCQVGK